LVYAFYGPLNGSASCFLFGFVADKTGGVILTTIAGIGLAIRVTLLITMGLVAPAGIKELRIGF
jgi:NNP family nitrate/nitrite transporter-like MFS transporter